MVITSKTMQAGNAVAVHVLVGNQIDVHEALVSEDGATPGWATIHVEMDEIELPVMDTEGEKISVTKELLRTRGLIVTLGGSACVALAMMAGE